MFFRFPVSVGENRLHDGGMFFPAHDAVSECGFILRIFEQPTHKRLAEIPNGQSILINTALRSTRARRLTLLKTMLKIAAGFLWLFVRHRLSIK